MLIVEGPDGAGKTQLVNRLAESLQMYVMPRVVSKDAEAMVDLVKWVHEDVTSGLKRAIYDRHRLISEPIYGPVLRGNIEPGFDSQNWLTHYHTLLRRADPFVIFCLPPIENVVKNTLDDPDNKVVEGKIELIYWLYFNMAAMWPTRSAVWDYTKDDEMSTYRGNSRYSWLLSDITNWMWEKKIYDHG